MENKFDRIQLLARALLDEVGNVAGDGSVPIVILVGKTKAVSDTQFTMEMVRSMHSGGDEITMEMLTAALEGILNETPLDEEIKAEIPKGIN